MFSVPAGRGRRWGWPALRPSPSAMTKSFGKEWRCCEARLDGTAKIFESQPPTVRQKPQNRSGVASAGRRPGWRTPNYGGGHSLQQRVRQGYAATHLTCALPEPQIQRLSTLMWQPLDLGRPEGAASRFTTTRGSMSLLPLPASARNRRRSPLPSRCAFHLHPWRSQSRRGRHCATAGSCGARRSRSTGRASSRNSRSRRQCSRRRAPHGPARFTW